MKMIRGGSVHSMGGTKLVKTGSWRTFKPVIDRSTCNNCKVCFMYCPDGIIYWEKGKDVIIDYDYCKGCGVCAEECPKGSIAMVREAE